MIALPILDSHTPALRVESLHAFGYCHRLFYLQEVERISVPHAAVFAGRELHTSLEADDEGEATSLELSSDLLGLYGKVDCLKRRDGSYLPYEHKRGKPARDPCNDPEAWPSDRLQIVAYALLLEEMFGEPIPEGRVRYHAENITVRVPIDEQARSDLRDAIATAQRLRASLDRPPITTNERLCVKCSLAPVCLPEEVRQQQDSQHTPVRLFPPDRDGATLHVMSQGAMIGRSADCLVVRPRDAPESKHPLNSLEAVVIHGFAQISTQALRACSEFGLGVHWLSMGGFHHGSMVASAGQVQRRIRQYRALCDDETCLRLAKSLAHAKIEGQHRYLLRASRGGKEVRDEIQRQLDGIHNILGRMPDAKDRDSLRGHEGAAAVYYFEAMRLIMGEQVSPEFRFDQRNRRPPRDRFNALLSFGYGLLHTAMMRAVLAVGLEPAFGFFHTPRSAAYPLVLDLMELFRVSLWDLVVVGSLNRNQWDPDKDFEVTKTKVWLSEDGRKKAITLFENRLQETWKHPIVDYSLSYARTMELEVRLLEKEWTGEPGLFAQSRLR